MRTFDGSEDGVDTVVNRVHASRIDPVEADQVGADCLTDRDDLIGTRERPRYRSCEKADQSWMTEFRNDEETQIVDSRDTWHTGRWHQKIDSVHDIDMTDQEFDGERHTKAMPQAGEPLRRERELAQGCFWRRSVGLLDTPVEQDKIPSEQRCQCTRELAGIPTDTSWLGHTWRKIERDTHVR
ncbi:hypothetical protein HRbin27_01841 [bacterium HR27]|nr:hypothetical protein HRbin27_01841 [bacterium HR27]